MKYIRETIIMDPHCVERFVPLEQACCRPLRDVRVVMSGLSDLEGRYEVHRENYPVHVALFTLKGTGRLFTPESRQTLTHGDLLVAPTGTRFSYELAGRRWQILWFHLDAREPWGSLASSACHVQHSHRVEHLTWAMASLLAEARDPDPDAQRAARALSELLALHLRRELEPRLDPAEREHRTRFAVLWDEVRTDPSGAWTVAALARRFGASPAHFHRLCLEHCASSPKRVVVRLRMLRAEELLRNTAYPLERVAAQVGYESAFALSTAFKRHVGVSPREYKRRLATRMRPA
jgi:AraC-like DNA-binding protein